MAEKRKYNFRQHNNRKWFRALLVITIAACIIEYLGWKRGVAKIPIWSEYRNWRYMLLTRWNQSISSTNLTANELISNQPNHSILSTHDASRNRKPLILIWQTPFEIKGAGPQPGERCGCTYTYDRRLAMESDAVVIYCRDAYKANLPQDFPNRTTTQKYVWWCREPPTHVKYWKVDLGYREGFFNWSMTYHRNSDIISNYGSIDDVKVELKRKNISVEELVNAKNNTAIAVVSNCGIKSQRPGAWLRLRLIKEIMSKGLDVDAFGKCLGERIDRNLLMKKLQSSKFYLAFENSYHCRDYISEKFWHNAIEMGLVPVVWGSRREDYEAIVPNSSFIFVEDFNSIEELVTYLKYLDKNLTAYSEYFQWRSLDNLKDFTHRARDPPISKDFSNACELCRHLLQRRQLKETSSSEVHSIKSLVYDLKDKDCLRSPADHEIYWKYGR